MVFSQVCASFGSDERTEEVTARLLADGTAWMSGSRWHGKSVLRISVSNWSTTDDDVARSLAALRKAARPRKPKVKIRISPNGCGSPPVPARHDTPGGRPGAA